MGLRNWIVDEKVYIVHVSIKDQLSVIYLLGSYYWMYRENLDLLGLLHFSFEYTCVKFSDTGFHRGGVLEQLAS